MTGSHDPNQDDYRRWRAEKILKFAERYGSKEDFERFLNMEQSYIKLDSHTGQVLSYVGPDATRLAHAITVRVALKMISSGISPRRGVTLTHYLKLTEEITKRAYRRNQAHEAIDDLKTWIEAMRSALPTVEEG